MGILKLLLMVQQSPSKQVQKHAGFTLIELLVGLIIAALVITPLLGFMINILQTDRREQAKARSEQELQTAAEYIRRDLDQAVYIYDADGVEAIKDQLLNETDKKPILVFWKRKFVPDILPVPTGTDGKNCNGDCNDTFVFSLVAYYLITDDGTTDNVWSGRARIGRFEIQDSAKTDDGGVIGGGNDPDTGDFQIDEDTPKRAKRSPGFQFDLSALSGNSLTEKMNNWKKTDEAYTNSADVLLDYIDHTAAAVPAEEDCPSDPKWQVVPSSDATYGFYACVDSDTHKTAQVFLRGNALGRLNNKNNIPEYDANISTFFPSVQLEATGSGSLILN
ncbi:MAG: prepilin-type N-terminal cleavage/methylation domain-containing protein [Symploca sp. SIO2E6]|nr:prepilin-type N-terminal cleavage/methylation domain-containing protein [Symploca sp. SIO2E6]